MEDQSEPGALKWAVSAREELRVRGRLRVEGVTDGVGPEVLLNGRRVLSFSSNDYLGMAGNAEVVKAFHVEQQAGSTGSRLISGTGPEHSQLEEALAEFHGAEGAVVFSSGYHLNTGLLPVLAAKGDLIVSDELNHASIIDGCRLSRAEVAVFDHLACDAAERRLQDSGQRKVLVTESVFSMDGDRAPLKQLREAADANGAMLVVDEAHAIGLLGTHGTGWANESGVQPDVLLGMFGKALGTSGAYMCATRALCDLVKSSARSYLFSTAPPGALMCASRKALTIIKGSEGDRVRDRLWMNCEYFRGRINSPVSGPIFPVVVGSEETALRCSNKLLELGVWVQPIRPPTVPSGSCRLRIVVTALHTREQLDRLIEALESASLVS